jgi:hypothetical protein
MESFIHAFAVKKMGNKPVNFQKNDNYDHFMAGTGLNYILFFCVLSVYESHMVKLENPRHSQFFLDG